MALSLDEMSTKMYGETRVFDSRMSLRMDELKWLYI